MATIAAHVSRRLITDRAVASWASGPWPMLKMYTGKVGNARRLAIVYSPIAMAKVSIEPAMTAVRRFGTTTDRRVRAGDAPRLSAASLSVRRSMARSPASSDR